jgi:hypothetical protein
VDHSLGVDVGDTLSTEAVRNNSEGESSIEPVNVGDSLSSESRGGSLKRHYRQSL